MILRALRKWARSTKTLPIEIGSGYALAAGDFFGAGAAACLSAGLIDVLQPQHMRGHLFGEHRVVLHK